MKIDLDGKPNEWKTLDRLSPKGGDCIERYILDGPAEFYIVVDSGALVDLTNGDETNNPPGRFRIRHDAKVVFSRSGG